MTNDLPPRQPGQILPSITDLIVENLWKLILVFLVFGAGGYAASYLMRPAYRAEALVMPVHNNSAGLLGGLVDQSGLGGVLGGLTGDVNKNESIQVISSRSLLRKFIEDHDLVKEFCAAKAMRCKVDATDDAIRQERLMNSAIDLMQKRLLSVNENSLTSAVRVSITWFDRKEAANWVNQLIDLTNRLMQSRAQEVASIRIKFLQHEYVETSLVPLQTALNSMLVSEMTKQVDAATQSQFAWHVIDPASPPDDRFPARPLRLVIATGAGFAALVLMIAWLKVRSARKD